MPLLQAPPTSSYGSASSLAKTERPGKEGGSLGAFLAAAIPLLGWLLNAAVHSDGSNTQQQQQQQRLSALLHGLFSTSVVWRCGTMVVGGSECVDVLVAFFSFHHQQQWCCAMLGTGNSQSRPVAITCCDDACILHKLWHCAVRLLCVRSKYPVTLEFCEDYPSKAPKAHFPKGFLHPNVYPDGKVRVTRLLQGVGVSDGGRGVCGGCSLRSVCECAHAGASC